MQIRVRDTIIPVRDQHLTRFRSFIYARNGRERLKTTRQMLMTIFSYHQVMPAVLDFLFPFGRQEYAKDFHFSGFRQDTCLAEFERGLQIPELGWSGLGIQLCYGLKSVETSLSQPEWPWSIRQCAIHHSLDLESGRGKLDCHQRQPNDEDPD